MGFSGGAVGKESTCQCRRHEMWARSLGQEDPLEKGMATHSSILAWEISWMEEPAGLQSMGSQRAEHSWAHTLHGMAIVLCLFKFPYIVTAFLRKLLYLAYWVLSPCLCQQPHQELLWPPAQPLSSQGWLRPTPTRRHGLTGLCPHKLFACFVCIQFVGLPESRGLTLSLFLP